ncbi:MAG: ABC transporter ATP-binding protein [Pseudonocardiales bacterium]|nr:ABC transporter ATP-binding protein [Pseudonocardiales bacterium]MBV9032237.1 ABC transporter ATP-binding protein [Pseudonocardiales bacterium]
MISASDVSFGYGGTLVLAGVGLLAGPGEMVGLIGPNGSGKTTLLRILYAALRPSAGTVSLDDAPVGSMRVSDIAVRIGVVAQEPPSEIPLTVTEMVLLGRSPHRSTFQSYTATDHRIAAAALGRVGARHLADRDYGRLSGGEKQRVLIARALAQQTEHLLLDEPTNHLDIRYQHEVLDLIHGIGVTTVVVLHDLNLAARYCDRLVLLDRGEVVAAGHPHDVLTPSVLEPVYGVAVRTLSEPDCVQLIFRLPGGGVGRDLHDEART